jgi:glutamate-1-semialdehyde 2,1-aminomutase
MTSKSERLKQQNQNVIPGGLVSHNRMIQPEICFERANGAYLWDFEGKRYFDYHAGFAPYLLGHNDRDVNDAVVQMIQSGTSLFGAGATKWEGELAELIVECVPTLDQVLLVNTGSEAVAYALRLARATTGRDQILIMQGGYNGWSDHVSFNLMDAADLVRDHQPGEEYTPVPITAGLPEAAYHATRIVEFNDLLAAEKVLSSRSVAAVILEPILHNVGVVKPRAGYLEGLRALCDRYGTILIFDEVKTGFRHALGGYQEICGVQPDLSVFGKAVANGYPLGVVGGKREIMECTVSNDRQKRVLIAGTYNGHPATVAAAIATLRKLKSRREEIYPTLEERGRQMEDGLNRLFATRNYPATVVRVGSTFTVYFMDHEPQDWKDIACNADFDRDLAYRRALIENGVFHFPVPTKQGSISFVHSAQDIDRTLEITETILRRLN